MPEGNPAGSATEAEAELHAKALFCHRLTIRGLVVSSGNSQKGGSLLGSFGYVTGIVRARSPVKSSWGDASQIRKPGIRTVRLWICLAVLFYWTQGSYPQSSCEGTTIEMVACMQQEHRKADTELKGLYQRVLRGVGASREVKREKPDSHGEEVGELLERAQNTWFSFREQECKARGKYLAGGSMAQLEILACKIQLTRERIRSLEQWMELLER